MRTNLEKFIEIKNGKKIIYLNRISMRNIDRLTKAGFLVVLRKQGE